LLADIKRLPEIYRRLQNGDYLNGERTATFEIWPTARPFITMEKGESLIIPLRVWRGQVDSHVASPAQDPEHKMGTVAPAQSRGAQATLPFPAGSVKYRIRSGGDQRGFWIDVEIAAVDKPGLFAWSSDVADPSTGERFPIELSALVYEENLIVNPRSLDCGEVSLEALQKSPIVAAQLNVRKMIGSIHIRGVSSTLDFVKGGLQVLVDGNNYLVKAYVVANPPVNPGKYEGTIRLDTDDPKRPRIDIPVKVTVVR